MKNTLSEMSKDDLSGSISRYIHDLQNGDAQAANPLVTRYWSRVLAAASKRLDDAGICVADGEDIAISVFDSLCKLANAEDETDIQDRDHLWRLLLRMINHKTIDLIRHERAKKRGSNQVVREGSLAKDQSNVQLGDLAAKFETPLDQVELLEEQTQLISSLDDDAREVITLRLEGYPTKEIAEQLGLSDRTVRRKLEVVKKSWANRVERLDSSN